MWYNNNIDKFIVLVQQNIILETVCLRIAFEFFSLDFFLEKCFNTLLISIFLGIPGSFHLNARWNVSIKLCPPENFVA